MRTTLHERINAGSDALATDTAGGDRTVVMCPPHPQYGGNKHDPRLKTVADALNERGISTLRFDYGDWTGGEAEVQDAIDAVHHAQERWSHVGLFGYSFGAGIAARATKDTDIEALGLLAPPADAAEHLPDIPILLVAGTNDNTLDSTPVATHVDNTVWLDSNHFFTGVMDQVAVEFAEFFDEVLG